MVFAVGARVYNFRQWESAVRLTSRRKNNDRCDFVFKIMERSWNRVSIFFEKRSLSRCVSKWTHSRRSSISYRTRASFHMLRAKLQSYDRYPLVARAFFFRIRNDRLLEIRSSTSWDFTLKSSARLRKILDERFHVCHQRVPPAFLTDWDINLPPTRFGHAFPLPTISTDRTLPTARGKKREDNFGRKQSRPTSSRFVSTFHVTQRRPMYESWDHPTRSRIFRRTERRTKIKRIEWNRGRGV